MEQFLHSQQRNTTCAMAALRTVLHRQFGVKISEAALVALGNDPKAPILKHGSSTGEMRRAVRGASKAFNTGVPWTLRTARYGTFRRLSWWLKHGRWPVVQVYLASENEHHAIVVTGLTATHVLYYDPNGLSRKVRKMHRKKFFDWWFCPINNERWFAVVNGGDLKEYSDGK